MAGLNLTIHHACVLLVVSPNRRKQMLWFTILLNVSVFVLKDLNKDAFVNLNSHILLIILCFQFDNFIFKY